ncbi:MRC1-like domain-containing protein [Dendryphion nanum]|uniref:MRC1-like domain-containing protein n=1 Tax=Dendryphion nanum TaxID=256645 RepID=A0A9P9ECJ9_9PLEO|nr:MRC1-like domain-containing protein [Dendryphion nanum]
MTSNNTLSKLLASDSEPDTIPIPRKGLLGRLRPQVTEESSESDDDDEEEGAYERVKRMLMSKQSAQETTTKTTSPARSPSPSRNFSENDSLSRATKARKLIKRKDMRSSPRVSPSPSTLLRRSSPGLFVTPTASPAKKATHILSSSDSESDIAPLPKHNKDLEERVRRIRAERKAAEKEKRAQAKQSRIESHVAQESDSDLDGENGRRLTQQARPTRKAGKKALEEMSREQQRISRNMQLAHQAKTKKKYSVKDLFSRLGYQADVEVATPTPDVSSVHASSDAEGNEPQDTPPTSPPTQEDSCEKDGVTINQEISPDVALEPHSSPPPLRTDKGKGRAPEFQHLPPNQSLQQSMDVAVQTTHVASAPIAMPTTQSMIELSDSDNEQEQAQPKSRFPVFDKLPQRQQQENSSLLHLRHLAHLTSPGKKGPKGRISVNMTELQTSLAQRARQQAQAERAEKIEDLKRRGIHIQTEEEREREQLEVENIVAQLEKAREEDQKLTKLEKAEAKKNGETGDGLLSSDESGDDDYVGSGEEAGEADDYEDEEELEVELSGSEDEQEEDVEVEDPIEHKFGLLDDAAEEGDDEDVDENDDEDVDVDIPIRKRIAPRARNVVVIDEDDSEVEPLLPSTPNRPVTKPAQPQQEDTMAAAFGFGKSPATLGLTQMFAGTMANLDSDSQYEHPIDKEPEQDSLDFLRGLPETQPFNAFTQDPMLLVPNSQLFDTQEDTQQIAPTPKLDLGISEIIETSPAFSHTQDFELTQDSGFGLGLAHTPAGMMPPPSTIDTLMVSVAESPVVKKKGRLQQRRQLIAAELSDVDEDLSTAVDLEENELASKPVDAFLALQKGAKKEKRRIDKFNKKTSWARDVVDEQAEESEDEYAGLGGASEDDSEAEDAELAEMIDTDDIKVDERQIAAFHAEKERISDEKNISKLYKDVVTGNLRKRRGGDAFDMSDSEDEAEQRRRKKQIQFKQMTKALMADERIGQIAQNPKKSAFFHSLADHLDDPDNEFLNAPEEFEISPSQSEEEKEGNDNENITVPDSQAAGTVIVAPANVLKRKSPDSQKENRPPPHMRRTAASDSMTRKPMTIADIQHSVSELLDDPRIQVPDSQAYDSDSDLEIEPSEPVFRKPIIDRLTLSRDNSIASDANASGNMAFHAASAGAIPGFRVPSLVRRATSNLSAVSTGSSGTNTPTEGSSVRRGGTGRSNIHAQAREAERRAALDKVEKKRTADLKKKVGRARNQRSVLANLGGGFE